MVTKLATKMKGMEANSRFKEMSDEWNEFFLDSIFQVVFTLCVRLAKSVATESSQQDVVSLKLTETMVASLCDLLTTVPDQKLLDHTLPALFRAEDVDASVLPDQIVFLLNHLSPLLSSSNPVVSRTGFLLLLKTMRNVAEHDDADYEENGDDHAELVLPRRLSEHLKFTEPIVDVFLKEFGFDFGEVLPLSGIPVSSAFHTAAKTYLMTWRLLLEVVTFASDNLRMKYSEAFRNHLSTLLAALFHLMESKKPIGDDGGLDWSLSALASSVFYRLLKHLPAMLRSYWNSMEKKHAALVEKFTMANATPVLWREEVDRITTRKADFDNMVVKVRPNVREVVASYTLSSDEGSMELVIQLPPNFPLGSVQVESGRRVGVTTSQWRTWMLQLTTFLQVKQQVPIQG